MPDCGLKRPVIKGGFAKGMAEVNKEIESHITGEMIIKKERKKVKEETKKGGRDKGKRREESALNEGKSLIVPRLWMRRISCRLRLSLLPEMGQRARIFISETQWPEVKCLATGFVLLWLMPDLRCSPNIILNDLPVSPI